MSRLAQIFGIERRAGIADHADDDPRAAAERKGLAHVQPLGILGRGQFLRRAVAAELAGDPLADHRLNRFLALAVDGTPSRLIHCAAVVQLQAVNAAR